MPTYLVAPPPPQQRMHFMDALENAGIDYSREPDGYFIYLRTGQEQAWEAVRSRFRAQIIEEEPPQISGI